jgi:hypothetical protein
MPTHDEHPQFLREFGKLFQAQQDRFLNAMRHMIHDLRAGGTFRASLRIKGVQGHPGVFEMTWAGDGRATFEYGPERVPGEPHIVWRRIGGHEIFQNP